MLTASKQEALLAVRLYTIRDAKERYEGFIVHVHIAWLYTFQANWLQEGNNLPRRFSPRGPCGTST